MMLEKLPSEKRRKQTIGFLGTESFYVRDSLTVEELITALEEREGNPIYALAVVDEHLKHRGLIVVRELYALIGRQYGRAIMGKKTVDRIMDETSPSFNINENIFAVGDQLEENLRNDEITYYLLHDNEQGYRGIFSSRDILIHLSNITKSDMVMAQSIQRKISREESSIHEPRFDLVASTQPVMDVGGDCYLIKQYRENRWLLSVCDASGKGIAASLLTTTIWGMMSIYEFGNGVMPFLKKVNNYLYETLESERFITGIFLDFDAQSGKVLIYDMGHSYLYIHRKGRLKRIPLTGNTPIGIQRMDNLSVGALALDEGDYLFIPTDGLLEQSNSEGSLYSIRRVEAIIRKNMHKPIEAVKNEIRQDFLDFKGREHVHDDVTFVLLKYYGREATDEYA
ncbi:MAG: SpoIIE family protein phosphatase [Spirochaetales bacterium]|nr:SpoIIE family protein phosphatase [Spirochaetales bacterium]